jgi:hypothetical protein
MSKDHSRLMPVAWDDMRTLYLVLYIVAAVLFAIAIFIPQPTVESGGRVRGFSLVAAGLLAWVAVDLIRQADLVNTPD